MAFYFENGRKFPFCIIHITPHRFYHNIFRAHIKHIVTIGKQLTSLFITRQNTRNPPQGN